MSQTVDSIFTISFPNRKPSKVVDKYRTSFPSGPLLIDASPQSKVFQGIGWFVILLSRYQTFSTAKTLSQSKYYTVLTLLWSWVKCFSSTFSINPPILWRKKAPFLSGALLLSILVNLTRRFTGTICQLFILLSFSPLYKYKRFCWAIIFSS